MLDVECSCFLATCFYAIWVLKEKEVDWVLMVFMYLKKTCAINREKDVSAAYFGIFCVAEDDKTASTHVAGSKVGLQNYKSDKRRYRVPESFVVDTNDLQVARATTEGVTSNLFIKRTRWEVYQTPNSLSQCFEWGLPVERVGACSQGSL